MDEASIVYAQFRDIFQRKAVTILSKYKTTILKDAGQTIGINFFNQPREEMVQIIIDRLIQTINNKDCLKFLKKKDNSLYVLILIEVTPIYRVPVLKEIMQSYNEYFDEKFENNPEQHKNILNSQSSMNAMKQKSINCYCVSNNQVFLLRANSPLITCVNDECKKTFHTQCFNITDSQTLNKLLDSFECPFCTLETNDPLNHVLKTLHVPLLLKEETNFPFMIEHKLFSFMKGTSFSKLKCGASNWIKVTMSNPDQIPVIFFLIIMLLPLLLQWKKRLQEKKEKMKSSYFLHYQKAYIL